MNLSKEESEWLDEIFCNDEDVDEENNEAFDKFWWLIEWSFIINRKEKVMKKRIFRKFSREPPKNIWR